VREVTYAAMGMVLAVTGQVGCRRAAPMHASATTRPAAPAGFVERTGTGWRIDAPSTWQNPNPQPEGAWVAVDPQPVDDYRANVSVVTEPFSGESRSYAQASEALLRSDKRATVEAARDEVVDEEPTVTVEALWPASPPSTAAFRTMQTHLASRGRGYVATCAASAGAFERYRSTCETIVRSFAVER
jgi:hypothetical protein